MLTTLGVVEVRPSPELCRLTAGRRLGGKSLIEWVVRRVTDSARLDRIVVLAPTIPECEELGDLVPRDIPLVLSSQSDAISRLVMALESHPAEHVVRVAAEHPFIDPVLIDRLISTAASHPEADYIGYCSRSGRPAVMSPLGMMGEWFSASALRKANETAVEESDREQITRYLYAHPEQFNLRLIPVPPELDRDDVRLTIDGEEDWEHTQTIFEALDPEHLDYQRIALLLDHQPALRKRMAALNRTAEVV